MSISLHTRWTRQLKAAQFDPSWKAGLERRVLGFLLSRYSESREVEDLGHFPFFEADSPAGRARVSPTHLQLKWRLGHIKQIVRESEAGTVRMDWGMFEISFTFQEEQSQPSVVEAIEGLEKFVASQLEGAVEARYQEAMRSRRW